jgi:predicted nucleic acid binding AN1-type Zn finger protein
MALISDFTLCTSISDNDMMIIQKEAGHCEKVSFKQLMQGKGLYCGSCGAPTEFIKACEYCGTKS